MELLSDKQRATTGMPLKRCISVAIIDVPGDKRRGEGLAVLPSLHAHCPQLWGGKLIHFRFVRIFVRYARMRSASLLLMMSSNSFSSVRMRSTWVGVRGLKRISCNR